MIGIYKITNKINHKIYIGQSVYIERRWQEHSRNTTSLIGKAIQKYSKDNFLFEVIEECSIQDLNKKEEFYIKKYNSVVPYGYNIQSFSNGKASQFNSINIDILILENIIKEIILTDETFSKIGIKYHLSVSTISRINSGEIHRVSELKYPLRTIHFNINNKQKYCKICGKEITSKATNCNSCASKINGLTKRKVKRPNRNELKDLIRNKSFVEISKIFNVSDKAIVKWCINENLPSKKKEIKSYSDEQWKLI